MFADWIAAMRAAHPEGPADVRRARLFRGVPVVRAARCRRALLRHSGRRRVRHVPAAASGAVCGAVAADRDRTVARAVGPLPRGGGRSALLFRIRRGASCCAPTRTSMPTGSASSPIESISCRRGCPRSIMRRRSSIGIIGQISEQKGAQRREGDARPDRPGSSGRPRRRDRRARHSGEVGAARA